MDADWLSHILSSWRQKGLKLSKKYLHELWLKESAFKQPNKVMLYIWALEILKDEDTCHDQAQMNSTLSMLLSCVGVLCNTAFGKAKRVSCCPLLKAGQTPGKRVSKGTTWFPVEYTLWPNKNTTDYFWEIDFFFKIHEKNIHMSWVNPAGRCDHI